MGERRGHLRHDHGRYPSEYAAAMPGPGYLEILDELHGRIPVRRYLEIGVGWGWSLTLARPGARAVAVDPTPEPVRPIAAETRFFRVTSDEFFATTDPVEVLGGPPDLVFVDGLHLHEQVLRDVANAERIATPGTVVVLHDVLPLHPSIAAREPGSIVWAGDVWRSVEALRRHRRDLRIRVVAAAPTGLAIVTGFGDGPPDGAPGPVEMSAEVAGLTWDFETYRARWEAEDAGEFLVGLRHSAPGGDQDAIS